MRLLIYNIRYATGTDWHFHLPLPFSGYLRKTHHRLPKLIQFLKSTNSDVIGLLEVDCGSRRTKHQCQPEIIARQLNHYCVYKSKYSQNSVLQKIPITNKQGNALLTNKRIQKQEFYYFRRGIKRLMMELDLEDVVILLVHLSLRFRPRQEQLQDIYTRVKTIRKPVILAGDFNVLSGVRELELFLASTGLTNANRKGFYSYPSRGPKREIDFILYSPEIKPLGFHMPDVRFSDHRPLIFDFDITSPVVVKE